MTLNEQQQRLAAGMSQEEREAHWGRLIKSAADQEILAAAAMEKEQAGEMLLIPSGHYTKTARDYRRMAESFNQVWHDFDADPTSWKPTTGSLADDDDTFENIAVALVGGSEASRSTEACPECGNYLTPRRALSVARVQAMITPAELKAVGLAVMAWLVIVSPFWLSTWLSNRRTARVIAEKQVKLDAMWAEYDAKVAEHRAKGLRYDPRGEPLSRVASSHYP